MVTVWVSSPAQYRRVGGSETPDLVSTSSGRVTQFSNLWWEGTFNVLQKKIGCFNHWAVSRVAGAEVVRFILVLEVNCISNLSPNHTLQLTTLRTFVRVTKTAFLNMMFLWWFSRRCSVVTISAREWLLLHVVWYMQVWPLSKMHDQWQSGKLPQLANKPLSLQLVCNHDNHSVAKTTNLFLQWYIPVHVWCLSRPLYSINPPLKLLSLSPLFPPHAPFSFSFPSNLLLLLSLLWLLTHNILLLPHDCECCLDPLLSCKGVTSRYYTTLHEWNAWGPVVI